MSPKPSSDAADRSLLRCERLVVGHRGRGLTPPLDLELRTGQFTLVVGRNGSGKTTWMRSMLGLHPPISGRVRPGIPAPRPSYVPQADALDELLPVRARDVVGWSRLRGWSFLRPVPPAGDREAVRRALAEAGAVDSAHQQLRHLSGGQKQRVLFARVLAGDADLFFLDEPTAAMDLGSERDAYRRLAALVRQRDIGVVVITHTIGVAAEHADQVLFLDPGEHEEGPVAAAGPPAEVFAHPMFRRHFGEVAV